MSLSRASGDIIQLDCIVRLLYWLRRHPAHDEHSYEQSRAQKKFVAGVPREGRLRNVYVWNMDIQIRSRPARHERYTVLLTSLQAEDLV